jgi:putative endonuclease
MMGERVAKQTSDCHCRADAAMTISGRAGRFTMRSHLYKWLKRLRDPAPGRPGAPLPPPDDDPEPDREGSDRAAAGAAGERAAAKFLLARGLTVVTRNWRNPRDRRDELDLVCRDREALVFVEVKSRAASALVSGYYAVDRRKKKVLRRAIAAYLRALHPPPATFRFDVVEVATFAGDRPPELRHFENVPLFSKHFRP